MISVFDYDVATLSKDSLATLRRRIGIVFQDFRLLDDRTAEANVALPLPPVSVSIPAPAMSPVAASKAAHHQS